MALSAAEVDALVTDLTSQYWQLSREYSEIADEQRREDLADRIGAIDYQLARLEEQRQLSGDGRARAMGAG
jgi:hypothetical protein